MSDLERNFLDAIHEVLDALEDMVIQHCQSERGYDSGFISANANALRVLVKFGRMEFLEKPSGRLVLARIKNGHRE